MGRAVSGFDVGFSHAHAEFAQKPGVLGGKRARQRRIDHAGAGVHGPGIVPRAAKGPEGRVASPVLSGLVLVIDGNGDGVDQGFQEGHLVLDLFLHRTAAQDVGHQQDHDVAQDEQADDDGPEDRDVDVVEGVGFVYQGKTGGQLVRGDAQAQHFPEVEDERVIGLGDDGQLGHGGAVQDFVSHLGGDAAFLEAAVQPPADDAVAEHELPGAVDGHVGVGPDGREDFVDGIDVLLGVLVEGNEKDHGLVGQVADPAEDAGQGQVVLVFEGEAAGEVRLHGPQLVADGHAGHRGVAEDDELVAAGMEAQGQFQGGLDVRVFENAGEIGVAVEPGGLEVVDAAKDHRRVGEQLVMVFPQEIEGIVVRGQDDLEAGVAVLELVEIVEHGPQHGIGVFLRVHVLDLQVHVEVRGGKRLAHAGQDLVGPLVAVLVGIEKQDVLTDLFSPGRAGQDQQEQGKATKKPSGHGDSRGKKCRATRPGKGLFRSLSWPAGKSRPWTGDPWRRG